MADEQTVNIPQLLLFLLVGGLALRFFFFSSSSTSAEAIIASNRDASNGNSNSRAREADVERVQQMFPQASRRHIMWDLQRNGGNIAATTERILSGRGLENPPISFQPLPLASSNVSGSSTPSARPAQPDLIKRYNLASKIVDSASAEPEETSTSAGVKASQKQAWSQNKEERQALLQRRREEMILSARRKMEAKVANEAFKSQSNQ